MITINLLPEEYRVREKKMPGGRAFTLTFLGASVFLLLTVFFFIDLLMSQAQLRGLEKEWRVLKPQADELKKLQTEVETKLKPEQNFFDAYVTTQKPLTYLLSWVSETLPDQIWLGEVKMERKEETAELFIKGYALSSKTQSSIQAIEAYLNQLKLKITDATLSLTTTRQSLEGHELTQFFASFEWGVKKS